MARIEYTNDKTKGTEEAQGSDGRLNVSARSDDRAYYNSRDEGQCYTMVFDHQGAVAAEYSAYLKNTSTTKDLVITNITLNAVQAARIKLWFVTGTAAGGTVKTPVNLNKASNNDAAADGRQGDSGDAITGLTTDGQIDFVFVGAAGHEEFHLGDRVRLGQNDAIAIEYDEGTTGDFGGAIYGYFE